MRMAPACSGSGSNFAEWAFAGSFLDMDFASGLAAVNQINVSLSALLTTTRASTAYADNAAGIWSAFSSNVPRITDKGLLVEEARTNSIRNNSMQGAAAGTPGTLPTNWSYSDAGLSQQIVGLGSISGIDYVDLRLFGTTTATIENVFFEDGSAIAGTNGQSWSGSVFLALVGGSLTNITNYSLNTAVRSAVPAYLGEMWTPTFHTTLSATLARFRESGTIAFASAATILPYLQLQFSSGVAVDFTLRIGWPQLELGAFATSPIRTTSAAATRAADAITVNNFSSWYGSPFGITMYAEFTIPQALAASSFPTPFSIWKAGDASNNQMFIGLAQSTGKLVGANSRSGGVNPGRMDSVAAFVAGTATKAAFAVAASDRALVVNGAAAVTSASGALPVGPDTAGVGQLDNGAFLNGYIRRLAFKPAREANAQMQGQTA